MDLPLTPIRDQVLIKPDEIEAKTASGILLTQTEAQKAQGKLHFGKVLATGPGVSINGELIPMDVAAGDYVVCAQYGPVEFEYKNQQYLICPQYDVMAVIND